MKEPVQEKKKYEKPAVIYTQVMESVAGACEDEFGTNGKVGGETDNCTMSQS